MKLTSQKLTSIINHTITPQENNKKNAQSSFISGLISVKQSHYALNKHGSLFQGVNFKTNLSRPGTIKNINATFIQNTPATDKNLYNPLNRHGNTFQALYSAAPGTKPGAIKNINNIDIQKEPGTKTNLHNPLNRHGNTFQALYPNATQTRPGVIRNINALNIYDTTTDKPGRINPFNKNSNTVQEFHLTTLPAKQVISDSITFVGKEDCYALSDFLTDEGCDLTEFETQSDALEDDDDIFCDDVPLFSDHINTDESKASGMLSDAEDFEEYREIEKKGFDTNYYRLTYLN